MNLMERFGDVQWTKETCKPGLKKDMNQGSFQEEMEHLGRILSWMDFFFFFCPTLLILTGKAEYGAHF